MKKLIDNDDMPERIEYMPVRCGYIKETNTADHTRIYSYDGSDVGQAVSVSKSTKYI